MESDDEAFRSKKSLEYLSCIDLESFYPYRIGMLNRSVLNIESFKDQEIEDVVALARVFKKHHIDSTIHHIVDQQRAAQKVVYLFFAEPSTRTRVSFETACDRLGVKKVSLGLDRSSVAKGETLEDTITTLSSLRPDALVFRSKKLKFNLPQDYPIPIINAGLGTQSHPTQALADLMTIQDHRNQIKGEKVLIVGDVRHSRVANSNFKLLNRFGAEVAYCSPADFTPSDDLWKDVKKFENLDEGVKWASILICLRVQEERHENIGPIGFSIAEYRDKFRIGYNQVKLFNSSGIILHPGPVVRGVEISNFALRDPRCRILSQVENGLYIRLALMCLILGLRK